ncbi:MAG TPA: NAD(P)H-dependent oxidoreductase subunit E [candidate division Zixibacteria bacterium]
MRDKDCIDIFSGLKGEEGDLIPILQRIQEKFRYIPHEAIKQMSRFLRISENQIFGVASFYSQFKFVEPGKCTIKVCMGTACHVRGSQSILDEFKRWLHIEPGQTTDDKLFTLETVNCLGACALGPIVVFDRDYHGLMKIKEVEGLIQKYRSENETESDAVT